MPKIMVVYHSQQFGNTKKMAEFVAEGCRQVPGVQVALVNVNEARVNMAEFTTCDGVAIGSPDYFSYVAGGVKQFFDDVWIARREGQATGDKPAVAFMSHGGGGRAMAALEKLMQSLKYEPVAPAVSCHRDSTDDAMATCRALGRALAEHVSK